MILESITIITNVKQQILFRSIFVLETPSHPQQQSQNQVAAANDTNLEDK